MKKILTALLIMLSFTLSAQEIKCDSTTWAQAGTYEIIRIEGTSEATLPKEVLSEDTLCTIEKSRKLNEIVELQISAFTIVRIYPKNIKAKN